MKRYSLIIVGLLIVPSLVLANPQRVMRQRKEMRINRPQGENLINLTDSQRDKLHSLRLKNAKKCIQLEADLKLYQMELEELIRDDASPKKVDEAANKVLEMRNKLYKNRINHRLQIQRVFTGEQKKIMKDHHFNMRFRGERRMGVPRVRSGFYDRRRRPGFGMMYNRDFLLEPYIEEEVESIHE